MTIADKTFLVTGANRGIGRALVAEALSRGAARVYAGTRQPLSHPIPTLRPWRTAGAPAPRRRSSANLRPL